MSNEESKSEKSSTAPGVSEEIKSSSQVPFQIENLRSMVEFIVKKTENKDLLHPLWGSMCCDLGDAVLKLQDRVSALEVKNESPKL